MAAYAADHGPVKTAATSSSSGASASSQELHVSVSSIPVYVAPTYQLAEQQQQSVVHEVVGYIQVPMQASAQQVYATIQVRVCVYPYPSTQRPAAAVHLISRFASTQSVGKTAFAAKATPHHAVATPIMHLVLAVAATRNCRSTNHKIGLLPPA